MAAIGLSAMCLSAEATAKRHPTSFELQAAVLKKQLKKIVGIPVCGRYDVISAVVDNFINHRIVLLICSLGSFYKVLTVLQ